MLQSIIIYIAVAASLYFWGKNISVRERATCLSGEQLPFWSYEIIISVLIFGVISGLRYQVGVDHISYLKDYIYLQDHGIFKKETFEEGFVLIAKFFSVLKLHYFFYFSFFAILQIGFVYYAFRNEKFLLQYIGPVIILGPYFIAWMNGIRQSVVICAFVFLAEFILKRKLLIFFISILLCSTIHRSALFLLPLYFIGNIKFSLLNKNILIMIVFLCLLLGITPYWLSLLNRFENLLNFVGYERYSEYIEILTSKNLRSTNFGPSRLCVLSLYLMIIWEYSKTYKFYDNFHKLNVYFTMFFIGVCLYNLFANTSHIFLRPIAYLNVFCLPLTAYTAHYLKMTNQIDKYLVIMFLACSAIFIELIKTYNNYSPEESIYYKFFFEFL